MLQKDPMGIPCWTCQKHLGKQKVLVREDNDLTEHRIGVGKRIFWESVKASELARWNQDEALFRSYGRLVGSILVSSERCLRTCLRPLGRTVTTVCVALAYRPWYIRTTKMLTLTSPPLLGVLLGPTTRTSVVAVVAGGAGTEAMIIDSV